MMATNKLEGLLLKRSRSDTSKTGCEPTAKRQHIAEVKKPVAVGIEACTELCKLLLNKAGAKPSTGLDSATVQTLLSNEFSPRAYELLKEIAAALAKENPACIGSDITQSKDEEGADAVVPNLFVEESVPPDQSADVLEHVVPQPIGNSPFSSIVFPPSNNLVPVVAEKSKTVPGGAAYKQETEIAISRIFDLGKVARVENPEILANAPHNGPSVVTMTGFGELGRFGNQLLQYMFLKCYATAHNISEIQVPDWVGAGLFGMNDRTVQRAFPPIVEFRGTLANSTFTTDFIDYVKNSNPGRTVNELTPDSLNSDGKDGRFSDINVDVWGWFQWNTSHFRRFKQLIQRTFTPVPQLNSYCRKIFEDRLRNRGGVRRTVVGLHLRLGDYQNISASSFGYCAPTSWYLEWLSKVWPTLENPVLFVASDDLQSVLRDFAEYSPLTADSIGLNVPESMKHLGAGFFPDWFGLTQCDVLAISNSTFSFSACLMNQRPAAQFFRAHYKERIVPIDPWNCDPIVHRDMNKAGISAALDTLQVVYNTQGSKGLARNLLYELPYYGLRAAIMKAVLWRQSHAKAVSV